MVLTKFQDHQPFGTGEEDFLRFLPYMGMLAILFGNVTWTVWTNFRFPIQEKLHMKNDFEWTSGIREENV